MVYNIRSKGSKSSYPLFEEVSKKEYKGAELVEVPRHFESNWYLIKQFNNIIKHKRLLQREVEYMTGITADTQYKNKAGITKPTPINVQRMEQFIEQYNEEIEEEFRIDVTALDPSYLFTEPLTDWHYWIIRSIEDVYGSVSMCPDDHWLLRKLQNSWAY